jgi:hypothetical protein
MSERSKKEDRSGALQRGEGIPCQSCKYSRRLLDQNEGNSYGKGIKIRLGVEGARELKEDCETLTGIED